MITINNGVLEVSVNEKGGSMTSIKKAGFEYQWQGSEESWTGQDVVIFPFIARLKDGFYTVDGKEYSMKNHGLPRYATLDVEGKKQDEVTLSLTWSEETLKQYPYKFKLFVNYKLIDDELKVSYKVVNLDDKTIYFGIGGHPAFNLPLDRKDGYDDISGNYIEFENEVTLDNYFEEETGSYLTHKGTFGTVKRIDLSKDLFKKYHTMNLTGDKMDKVTLHRRDGIEVKMRLNNPKVLAIWSKPTYGSYVCIEPWQGIPDFDNPPSRELKDKELINSLEKGNEFVFSYSIIL